MYIKISYFQAQIFRTSWNKPLFPMVNYVTLPAVVRVLSLMITGAQKLVIACCSAPLIIGMIGLLETPRLRQYIILLLYLFICVILYTFPPDCSKYSGDSPATCPKCDPSETVFCESTPFESRLIWFQAGWNDREWLQLPQFND